jgi:hypothetical protein
MHVVRICQNHTASGVQSTGGTPRIANIAVADGGFDEVNVSLIATGVVGAFVANIEGGYTTDGPWFTLLTLADSADGQITDLVPKFPLYRANVTTLTTSLTLNAWLCA